VPQPHVVGTVVTQIREGSENSTKKQRIFEAKTVGNRVFDGGVFHPVIGLGEGAHRQQFHRVIQGDGVSKTVVFGESLFGAFNIGM